MFRLLWQALALKLADFAAPYVKLYSGYPTRTNVRVFCGIDLYAEVAVFSTMNLLI
jgi:hypothetical protein